MTTVLQLSDPHLLADPTARLRGVPTAETLAKVLALAEQRAVQIDAIVLTGDLAHDEQAATYERLHEAMGPHAPRCWPLPGNHDDRHGLRSAFTNVQGSGDERVQFCVDVGRWRLIGLDSQIPGQNPGRLGSEQLSWLVDALARRPERPTVLFVHHPPVPTGHTWLDAMGLLDADALADVLRDAPTVRAICHGHIHCEFEGRLAGVPVWGAPSTAFQFPARADLGDFDLRPPGARLLHLHDNTVHTEILRLPRLEYVPVPRTA
ncbi:MAG: phosphodiesterase [Deltaproteobacteria bacterium]|nr:phosphodiesterase [Deltaproteobacteria bacterium]